MVTKWEYLWHQQPERIGGTSNTRIPTSEDLDEFGNEGWELVAIHQDAYGNYNCWFKRPKSISHGD